MKKLSTILREIDNLEKELYSRFTSEQIVQMIEKEEIKKEFYGGSTGLISVIYEGTYNDMKLKEEFPDY